MYSIQQLLTSRKGDNHYLSPTQSAKMMTMVTRIKTIFENTKLRQHREEVFLSEKTLEPLGGGEMPKLLSFKYDIPNEGEAPVLVVRYSECGYRHEDGEEAQRMDFDALSEMLKTYLSCAELTHSTALCGSKSVGFYDCMEGSPDYSFSKQTYDARQKGQITLRLRVDDASSRSVSALCDVAKSLTCTRDASASRAKEWSRLNCG